MQASSSQNNLPESLTNVQLHFVRQGLAMLQKETMDHRLVMIQRLTPGDNNVATLVEYYDKRAMAIKELQDKFQ